MNFEINKLSFYGYHMKTPQYTKLIGMGALCLVVLAACDEPGPAQTAGKKIDQSVNDAGRRISESADKVTEKMGEQRDKAGMAIDDAEITTKVKAAIFAAPGLKTLQISVDTINGVVTLSGSVDSPASSDLAKALASAVAGVSRVRNQLVLLSKN
jgi:osmotically-inducible protein OsmY